MTIASDITRLNGAKTGITASIESKGVGVPAGTRLDGCAELIDGISVAPPAYVIYTLNASNQTVAAEIVGMQELPTKMFNTNGTLTQVTLPAELTMIGDMTFYQCRALELDAFPPGLVTIGPSAFYYCDQINDLVLPASVASIDNYAFRLCSGALSLWVKGNPTIAGSGATNAAFSACTSLASAILGGVGYPMDDSKLPAYCLFQCVGLTSLTVYTAGGVPLANAPFGAANATVTYLSA